MSRTALPDASTWAPTLRRSWGLFRAFRYEQPDPPRFYNALALDSVMQVRQYVDLSGKLVLDVGGGPGYFADAFEAAGATYVSLDSDVGEMAGRGRIRSGSVVGSGLRLPFADASVDVCYSSNVLEHVPEPWRMAAEMLRVTRPGGTTFISYTVWWGPGAVTRRHPGTSWAATVRDGATSPATATSPRTGSASRCSRSP